MKSLFVFILTLILSSCATILNSNSKQTNLAVSQDTSVIKENSWMKFIHSDRPKLLLGGGMGFGGSITQAVMAPNYYEWYAGFAYKKTVELFYHASMASYADIRVLSNDSLNLNPDFTTSGVRLRFYPIGPFFGEAGYHRIRFGAKYAPQGHSENIQSSYTSTTGISIGIGWASDVWFARIARTFGIGKISIFDLPPSSVSFTTVCGGLNIRI
jgi:hypothetical protein